MKNSQTTTGQKQKKIIVNKRKFSHLSEICNMLTGKGGVKKDRTECAF